MNYIYENGRRYHAYHAGSYWYCIWILQTSFSSTAGIPTARKTDTFLKRGPNDQRSSELLDLGYRFSLTVTCSQERKLKRWQPSFIWSPTSGKALSCADSGGRTGTKFYLKEPTCLLRGLGFTVVG